MQNEVNNDWVRTSDEYPKEKGNYKVKVLKSVEYRNEVLEKTSAYNPAPLPDGCFDCEDADHYVIAWKRLEI